MKRPWLTLSLTTLVFGMAGSGIYRVSTEKLTHAVTHFREALPPDAQFTYRSVTPNFFVNGVTLTDVTFRYQKFSFQAQSIRLGNPRILPKGDLILSSLLLTHPHYTDHKRHLTASKVIFRHLLVPTTSEIITEDDRETVGMRSLAAIMSFNPSNLTSCRFERMHIDNLNLFIPPPLQHTTDLITFHTLSAGSITFDGYGQGSHVLTSIDHLNMTLDITPHAETNLSPLLATLFLPTTSDQQKHISLPATLQFDHIEARQGRVRWLKRPFQENSQLAEELWHDPLKTLWESSGTFLLSHAYFLLSDQRASDQFTLQQVFASRREEKNLLKTEIITQGLSYTHTTHQLSPETSSLGTLHFLNLSQRKDSAWENNLSLTSSINTNDLWSLKAHINLPLRNPLKANENEIDLFTRQSLISEGNFLFKGNTFPALWHLITPPNTSTENSKNLLATLATERPLFAPLEDYFIAPLNRSLTFSLGHISFFDIGHLPITEPPETLADSLHITNVKAQ